MAVNLLQPRANLISSRYAFELGATQIMCAEASKKQNNGREYGASSKLGVHFRDFLKYTPQSTITLTNLQRMITVFWGPPT